MAAVHVPATATCTARDAMVRGGLAQAFADGLRIADQALEAVDVDDDLTPAVRRHARRHHARDIEQHTHVPLFAGRHEAPRLADGSGT